ncbi:MAG: LPP20 family lipoprotein [Fidelibacterota bacterium]
MSTKYLINPMGIFRLLSRIFFILIFLWGCTSHPEPLPDWGVRIPNDPDYWYGLGIANTREDARQHAINEISSQISITISSTLSGIKTEYNFNINEFTKQVVETRVNSSLNNIELVDSYQSNSKYYVLARLSKQKYYDEIELKKNNAIQQALNYLERTTKDFSIQSIKYLDFALNEIEPFQDYPMIVEYPENSGNKIMLRPYLSELVINFSERLRCTFSENEIIMYYGIPDPKRLFVDCVDNVTNERMEGVPVNLYSPENDLTDKVLTNSEGFSEVIVRRVLNKEPVQYIRGEVDYTGILSYFPHRFNTIINRPVRLSVRGVKIYFTGTETNLGLNLGNPIIGPELKALFSRDLLAEPSTRLDSDFTASYFVQTVQRSQRPEIISGRKIYQTYADMTLTVTDTRTGNEIFQNTISNVKGVSYTAFEDAGMDAIKKLKNKLEVPGFLDPDRFQLTR